MRKRHLLFAAVLLLVVAAGAGVLWITIGSDDPLAIAHRKIQDGMTLQEAVAIIGRTSDSGGWQSSAPDWKWHNFDEWFGMSTGALTCKLQLRSIDDRIIGKLFVDYRPTFWEKCRQWLKSATQF